VDDDGVAYGGGGGAEVVGLTGLGGVVDELENETGGGTDQVDDDGVAYGGGGGAEVVGLTGLGGVVDELENETGGGTLQVAEVAVEVDSVQVVEDEPAEVVGL
jgi:hypothetical protein